LTDIMRRRAKRKLPAIAISAICFPATTIVKIIAVQVLPGHPRAGSVR